MAKFTHFDRLTLACTVDLAHGISGAAGLARFFPPEEHKPQLRETLRDALLPELAARPGMHGAVLLENDLASSDAINAEVGHHFPENQIYRIEDRKSTRLNSSH